MDGIAELLRHRSHWIVGRQDLISRRLAVGAPVALDLARIHIDHGHTVVQVTVREVGLVGLLIEIDLRDPSETLLILAVGLIGDRKSTRLNSSHANISYAVFCLKKKKKT